MAKNKTLMIVWILVGVFTLQLILPFCFVVSIFIVKRRQQEIIENYALNQNLFVTISLDETEFSNLGIQKDEFTHNNKLYDIHSIQKINGRYVIRAIKDDNEKKLKLLTQKAVRKTIRNTVKLLKTCNCMFAYFERNEILPPAFNLSITNFKLYKLKFIATPYLRIPSPPPDIC